MDPWIFSQPGNLADFDDPSKWHNAMKREADGIIEILVDTVLLGKEPAPGEFESIAGSLAYVNPTVTSPPSDAVTVGLNTWSAFPNSVSLKAPWKEFPPDNVDPDGQFRAADAVGAEDFRAGTFVDADDNILHLPVRHRQDEYCEWVVRRDSKERIIKAIFVAEGYDYYSELFDAQEHSVVEIYREFTENSSINADHLRAPKGIYFRNVEGKTTQIARPGGFNPRNRYNISPGIVHLSHQANSLGAEVNLAGVSGIARKLVNDDTLDGVDARRLLCCAKGGDPNRNSDPSISKQAYELVLKKKHYTLANPVGLYISGIAHDRLRLKDGTPAPVEWWKTIRGSSDDRRVLRLELEVPKEEGFVLGDLTIDGTPLLYGSQLAELLSIHLFVTHWDRFNPEIGPRVSCDATCCVKTGTDVLSVTKGACRGDFKLMYPGLIGNPTGPALLAAENIPKFPRYIARPGRRLP